MYKVQEMKNSLVKEYDGFNTLDDAVKFIATSVEKVARDAYGKDKIDKYALEDILFDNKNYIKGVWVFHMKIYQTSVIKF